MSREKIIKLIDENDPRKRECIATFVRASPEFLTFATHSLAYTFASLNLYITFHTEKYIFFYLSETVFLIKLICRSCPFRTQGYFLIVLFSAICS